MLCDLARPGDLAGAKVRRVKAVVGFGGFQVQCGVQQARPAQAIGRGFGAQRAPEALGFPVQAFISIHAIHAGRTTYTALGSAR